MREGLSHTRDNKPIFFINRSLVTLSRQPKIGHLWHGKQNMMAQYWVTKNEDESRSNTMGRNGSLA